MNLAGAYDDCLTASTSPFAEPVADGKATLPPQQRPPRWQSLATVLVACELAPYEERGCGPVLQPDKVQAPKDLRTACLFRARPTPCLRASDAGSMSLFCL